MSVRAVSNPIQNVVLGSDFPVTSNAALANVPGFSIPLIGGGTYLIEAVLWMYTNGATNGGWRFGFTYSGTFGNPNLAFIGGMVTTAGTYNGSFISLNGGTLTSLSNANPDFGQYAGIVNPTGNGTLQVQFAQNTSNGTATILKAGSALQLTRMA